LAFFFLFVEINALKRQLMPEMAAAARRETRKAESLIYTEINITTSTDEG
jgi:hypothetical protein